LTTSNAEIARNSRRPKGFGDAGASAVLALLDDIPGSSASRRIARSRFEAFAPASPADSYPEPCRACERCHWHDLCDEQRGKDNHLTLVANIQRSRVEKLPAARVQTYTMDIGSLFFCSCSKTNKVEDITLQTQLLEPKNAGCVPK
jgi:hypothetical protein